ncbi:MAG: hypothetical protein SPF30_05495 [Arcanobacterium sp.]|nr:hypothetical protein [Arcanobacterium sp.]
MKKRHVVSEIPEGLRKCFGQKLQAAARTNSGQWLAASFGELRVWSPEAGADPSAELGGQTIESANAFPTAESGNSTELESSLHIYPWVDFARGTYRGETAQLQLSFIDPAREPLLFELAPEQAAILVPAILERVDDSIVYQEFAQLVSGEVVSAQMRRRADGTLFAQVPWYMAHTSGDRAILAALEYSVKEAVGE